MTNMQSTQASCPSNIAGRGRRARRLCAALLGLAIVGATYGVSTSPGRSGSNIREVEAAIPGVRGTGGGAGATYGFSSSPGSIQLALTLRKAGGNDPLWG